MNEETEPRRRSRPTYGLPGPRSSEPAPGPAADGSGHTGPWSSPPASPHDPALGSGSGAGGHPSAGPAWPGGSSAAAGSPAPGSPGSGGPGQAWPPGGSTPAAPARRRGLIPLLVGIAALVLGVVALVVGFGGAVANTVGPVQKGATEFGGPSAQLELEPGQMYYIYVPEADADAATCSATTESGTVQAIPVSGGVTLGDGRRYEQKLGIAAENGASVTVTCEGTDGAAYLGPIGLWSTLRPVLIGVAIGAVLGLLGLILTITGIVRLVRSGRARTV